MLDYSYLDKARKAGAESIWFADVSAEELLSVIKGTIDGEKRHIPIKCQKYL